MCDAIQGVPTNLSMPGRKTPSPGNFDQSVTTEVATANFAAWFKDKYLPDCKCFLV